MNLYRSILLIFGVAILSTTSNVFAEQGVNYDRSIINVNGNEITYSWTGYPYNRIFDGTQYVSHIFDDTEEQLIYKSAYIDFEFNKSDCSFRLYNPETHSIEIQKFYSEILIDDSKRNTTCSIEDLILDGSKINFTANQGVYETDYYLDKIFGEEHTYRLNNIEGKQSNYTIIETCEECTKIGKVNDVVYFGYYNYDPKNEVHQTLKKSHIENSDYKITFETSLIDKGIKVIDPTFGFTAGEIADRIYDPASTSSSCGTSADGRDSSLNLLWSPSGVSGRCQDGIFQWETSSIDDSATVQDVQLKLDVDAQGGAPDCQVFAMPNDFDTQTDEEIWDAIGTDTQYVGTWTDCQTTGNNKQTDLGSTADSDLESQLANDWFAISLSKDPRNRESTSHSLTLSDVELEVTYTLTTNPDAVDDLSDSSITQTTVGLTWTQPDLQGNELQSYLVNYTTPHGNPTTVWDYVNTTSDTVTGLTLGTDYSFRVTVITQDDFLYNITAPISKILNVTTLATNPPDAVDDLTATTINFTSIYLDWTQPDINGETLTGYRVWWDTFTPPTTIQVSDTGSTDSFYNATGLNPATLYYFKISAITTGGTNSSGNIANATTNDPAQPIKDWMNLISTDANIDDAFGVEIGISAIVLLFGVGLAQKNVIYGSVLFGCILGIAVYFDLVQLSTTMLSTIVFFIILIIFSARNRRL